MEGERTCDVVIVGGGFCGLSAALRLAEDNTNVVLIEQHRLGDGASGRNGGQMGTGQRAGVLELEEDYGTERARALWDMAEDAKRALLGTARRYGFDPDYVAGQLTAMHKARYETAIREEVDVLNSRYGYHDICFLEKADMATALGSTHYFAGTRDMGTGHIHRMKYIIGLAKAAQGAGAELFENTTALSVKKGRRIEVETPGGTIIADKCLLALNGHHGDLRAELASRVLPIQSFIGATHPLPADSPVLPGGEAVDDSRFVVRYFRKTTDNRLLFGGREAYGKANYGDIRRQICRQVAEIYPELANVELTHAWGGNVAITLPRKPYVRELEPGLWTAGGFAGHGVMLSNYTGLMIAENFLGKSNQINLLKELKIPPFPGGKMMRNPLKVLALTWYAMLDRL